MFGLWQAVVFAVALVDWGHSSSVPTDNPVVHMYGPTYGWANNMVNWTCVVDASKHHGDFNKAQKEVQSTCGKMGGVVYYPAGEWKFNSNLEIQSNVVIRGEPDYSPAKHGTKPGNLNPKTKFLCPKMKHMGIFSTDKDLNNVGVVNIYLKGCAVMLWPSLEGGGSPPFQHFKSYWFFAKSTNGAGSNKLVLGNVVQDVTLSDPDPPVPETEEQMETLRRLHPTAAAALNVSRSKNALWPWSFSTAIAVYSNNNSLIANNRLPPSDLHQKTSVAGFHNIPYPFDNRYGIDAGQIIYGGVWGHTSGGPCKATSKNSPYFFDRGQVVRDNWVYQNGRVGVSWTGGGDGKTPGTGTVIANNHVKVAANTYCYSVNGKTAATGHDTNENRGYNQQGFENLVANNTGDINKQKIPKTHYTTVDGEGILHQCSSGTNGLRNLWSDNDLTYGSSGPVWYYNLIHTDNNVLVRNKGIKIVGAVYGKSPYNEHHGNKCHDNKPKCTGF